MLAILLVAIMAGAIAGVYNKYFVTPMYQSTSKLYILSSSTSITSFADIQIGDSLTQDYMELIYSRPLVEEVIQAQRLDETYETLIKKVSAKNPSDTRILAITVTYDEPHTAKAIVDCFAEVSRKSISNIMSADEPNIVEYGHVNTNKVSPNVKKNCLIAAAIAAILLMAIYIILYLLNDTIRSEEDIEKYVSLTVLSSIPYLEPEETKSSKKNKKRIRSGGKHSEKNSIS